MTTSHAHSHDNLGAAVGASRLGGADPAEVRMDSLFPTLDSFSGEACHGLSSW